MVMQQTVVYTSFFSAIIIYKMVGDRVVLQSWFEVKKKLLHYIDANFIGYVYTSVEKTKLHYKLFSQLDTVISCVLYQSAVSVGGASWTKQKLLWFIIKMCMSYHATH